METNTEKTYFWDNLKPVFNWIERFKRKLLDENDSISLSDLGGYIYQTYTNQELETIHNRSIEEYDNILFDFVLKLLKDKELKVGRMKTYEKNAIIPPEDIKEGMPIIIDYTGTPEEIVARLKKEWNDCIDEVNKNKTSYEIDIVFTLPENKWLKYINY